MQYNCYKKVCFIDKKGCTDIAYSHWLLYSLTGNPRDSESYGSLYSEDESSEIMKDGTHNKTPSADKHSKHVQTSFCLLFWPGSGAQMLHWNSKGFNIMAYAGNIKNG